MPNIYIAFSIILNIFFTILLFTFSSVNSDEEQLVIEAPDVLSKQRIILLNLAWFGLSLMFLLLSVEGKV